MYQHGEDAAKELSGLTLKLLPDGVVIPTISLSVEVRAIILDRAISSGVHPQPGSTPSSFAIPRCVVCEVHDFAM
jgi:hypothetical protein